MKYIKKAAGLRESEAACWSKGSLGGIHLSLINHD
jgi:hypothetical protein